MSKKRPSRGLPSGPDWLLNPVDGSTPETVKAQEKQAAKLVESDGWSHRRRGSGSNPLAKGDAVSKLSLGEAKQTVDGKEYRLKWKELAKIEDEARELGKMPFLHIRFLREDRFTKNANADWVVLTAQDFSNLVEAANRNRESE